jgi:dihydrofolate synthase/folylpolyglutamate synthase
MLNYDQAIEYLESFINYEKLAAPYDPRKWKLERMYRLLSAVGDPHHGLRFIHIAGTKGKGSTAAMIASILQTAGFKVGLYTSPHLITFRERIRINGEMISEDQVSGLVTQIKPYVDELRKHEDQFGIFSFFDVYTTLGILFFWIEKVDFAVLEVGMGGRLDATNVVQPLVSVITQISYDHTISLGSTIESIATEKAGIIKDNGYVVTSPQVPEALEIIRNTCAEKKARLFQVGVDIHFRKDDGSFNVTGIFSEYRNLRIPLIGDHQMINAATAIGALELLRFHDFTVTVENVRTGFEKVKWPARVQVISQNPTIVVDVAHNEASAKALRETIESNFKYGKLILVIGISQHKDIKGIGRQICSIADQVILTKVNNPRAMEPEDMKAELSDICEDAIITQDVPSALEKARSIAGPTDLICIMGSVYLAGEAMQALGESTNGDKA